MKIDVKGNKDHLDAEQFSFAELLAEIKEQQRQDILWILEEYDLQFSENLVISTWLAEEYLKYFDRSLQKDPRQLRDIARIGVEQIIKRFPELQQVLFHN
jgi:hypothetical protein